MRVWTVRTMCPMNCHPTCCGMPLDVADGPPIPGGQSARDERVEARPVPA